eukprot:CAMPEP_0202965486 /NCGR_PEP_ID=MMETSP1396-20130829/9447_1 /ASSEMBLY_ACC=CAM_ASM_000872 /TAXON_ID= /ORGANISM="Pseudokeronopsis sp., Strain Brazil" /LENGTH=46 /DNA_ID= /DNA_START= /DNA_END= /DNA_ORIENTATION=
MTKELLFFGFGVASIGAIYLYMMKGQYWNERKQKMINENAAEEARQ